MWIIRQMESIDSCFKCFGKVTEYFDQKHYLLFKKKSHQFLGGHFVY